MSVGTPTNVRYGPGQLYIAALASSEPTDLVSAWPGAWTLLGYTKNGHVFDYAPDIQPIVVEEELDPIAYASVSRKMSLKFELAETTATNLKRALNGGSVVTGSGIVTFTPPTLGAEVDTMLGWQSQDAKERWIFRKCKNTGDISVNRKKAPDYSTIPVEFMVQALSGATPFSAIFDSTIA